MANIGTDSNSQLEFSNHWPPCELINLNKIFNAKVGGLAPTYFICKTKVSLSRTEYFYFAKSI